MGTTASGCGSMEGEYLFHCAVLDGCLGVMCGVCGRLVRHSAEARCIVMSIRYKQCA